MLEPIEPFNRQTDEFGLAFITHEDQSRTLDQMLARINELSQIENKRKEE